MRISALRALFSDRNYVIYTAGNAISLTGSWIYQIAFGWLVWEMTKSPLWIGIVAVTGLAPVLLSGLLGGVLADRFDRLKLTASSQFAAFLLVMMLFICHNFDILNLPLLITFRVLLASAIAISQPARLALVVDLVGQERVGTAVSVAAVVFNIARLIGPALAGVILAYGGFGVAFLVNALSFLVLTGAILCIRLPPRAIPTAAEGAGFLQDMRTGVAYVLNHHSLFVIFSLFLMTVFAARSISELLPAFVDGSFGRGVEGVAILTSAMAIGSIIGGLWSAGRAVKGSTVVMVSAAAFYAACIGLFAIAPNFWIACATFTLAGFFTVTFGTSAQTLVQTNIRDDMRGRVMSLWFITMRGGPELGAFVMGLLAETIGLSTSFVIGSGACLWVCLWAWRHRTGMVKTLEEPALA